MDQWQRDAAFPILLCLVTLEKLLCRLLFSSRGRSSQCQAKACLELGHSVIARLAEHPLGELPGLIEGELAVQQIQRLQGNSGDMALGTTFRCRARAVERTLQGWRVVALLPKVQAAAPGSRFVWHARADHNPLELTAYRQRAVPNDLGFEAMRREVPAEGIVRVSFGICWVRFG